jgi:tetratricopeptide (TPR) repeat protein
LFSAQDAITNDIGNRLLARFGYDAVGSPAVRGTNNEEAYGFYLLAMNLSEERGIQNLQKCLEYLQRAVTLDPNYGRAWAGIALVHGDMIGHTDSDQQEHYGRGMEAITKALAIEPNLSAAHSALCYFNYRYEYRPIAAETECKRALDLEPSSPEAHKTFATFLYSQGRFDQAISEIKTAIELQPVSYRNQQIYGLTLYFARRFPEAEAQFKHLLELNPNHNYINEQLITILEIRGKESEAFEYLIKSLSLDKTDIKVIERYRTIYARSGWRGVMRERIKTSDGTPVPGSYSTACLYARLGEKDKAFEFLEKAFQERSFRIAVLKVEPQLDTLRDDPRYEDLVRRIEGS